MLTTPVLFHMRPRRPYHSWSIGRIQWAEMLTGTGSEVSCVEIEDSAAIWDVYPDVLLSKLFFLQFCIELVMSLYYVILSVPVMREGPWWRAGPHFSCQETSKSGSPCCSPSEAATRQHGHMWKVCLSRRSQRIRDFPCQNNSKMIKRNQTQKLQLCSTPSKNPWTFGNS